MRVADINTLDRAAFVATLGGVFEHSRWVAEGAWAMRPFQSVDALHTAMLAVVNDAGEERQLALLPSRAKQSRRLARVRNVASRAEFSSARISKCLRHPNVILSLFKVSFGTGEI